MSNKKTRSKVAIGAIAVSSVIFSHIYVGANQNTTNLENMPAVTSETANIDCNKKEVVVSKPQRKDLNNFLFIGDSFTYLLKDTIRANNENVYIHAKSGSRPSYWLNKVAEMPNESDVEGIVLLIGVNGASTDANKENVVKLMDIISEKYPNTQVYVQKIFPVGKDFHSEGFNEKIDILNDIIKNHVETLDNFHFINTTEGFVDENGNLMHTYDELHIDSEYNNLFYENIFNAIKNEESNI